MQVLFDKYVMYVKYVISQHKNQITDQISILKERLK